MKPATDQHPKVHLLLLPNLGILHWEGSSIQQVKQDQERFLSNQKAAGKMQSWEFWGGISLCPCFSRAREKTPSLCSYFYHSLCILHQMPLTPACSPLETAAGALILLRQKTSVKNVHGLTL